MLISNQNALQVQYFFSSFLSKDAKEALLGLAFSLALTGVFVPILQLLEQRCASLLLLPGAYELLTQFVARMHGDRHHLF